MLQKGRFLTPGKFTWKNKKGLVKTIANPLFLVFSPSLPLFCALTAFLSQSSLDPVKNLIFWSSGISGSFWRGRRWGLETQTQIFKCARESPEFLGEIFMDGSRCGTPDPVIVLSLCSLKIFANWREVVSMYLAPWVVWDGENGQGLHKTGLLDAGGERYEVIRGAELSCGNFRGHQVPTQPWPSLAAWVSVCEKSSHWQIIVLLGKI